MTMKVGTCFVFSHLKLAWLVSPPRVMFALPFILPPDHWPEYVLPESAHHMTPSPSILSLSHPPQYITASSPASSPVQNMLPRPDLLPFQSSSPDTDMR